MEFYYIRHAQSVNNALWERTGSSQGRSVDPELTELGRQQTERLAQFLDQNQPLHSPEERNPYNVNGFGLTHIYTSPMIRAVETAKVVANRLSLPLVAWMETHEEGGIYRKDEDSGEMIGQPGKDRQYFQSRFPDLVLPDGLGENQGWWNRPFEEPEERPHRARRFLNVLLDRHGASDDRVALISHGGFYNYFLGALLDIQVREGLWFTMNNTAITRVDFTPQWANLVYQNRVEFLPPDMVS
jgi:2,3-bisphosphoglycerate-dependent phosphoglycerate mutase